MSSLSTCRGCGARIAQGDRFCSNCGTEQTGSGPATADGAPASPWETILDRLSRATAPRYRILRLLGHGGFAGVYLAEEVRLGRKLAIKVMAPGLMVDPKLVARFQQESRTTAQLLHPNVVTVYDVDERDGLHYFVMAYVPGRTLSQVLASKSHTQLPRPVIRHVLYQVGSALAYAHRMGVVHRDVKPSNILLDADVNAMVTDFGIAKVADEPSLTKSGILVGTPAYMSPEQCSSATVSSASDQYSLGVVAYELLTGRPPFTGATVAVVHAHMNVEPVPVRERNPDAPEATARAVERMLAKEPADRFPTILAALSAMEASQLRADDPIREEIGSVTAAVDSLRIDDAPDSVASGSRVRLRATALDGLGRTLESRPVSWASSDGDVAAVDDTGELRARAAGMTAVTATCEGVTALVSLTVVPAPEAERERDTPIETVRDYQPLHEGPSGELEAPPILPEPDTRHDEGLETPWRFPPAVPDAREPDEPWRAPRAPSEQTPADVEPSPAFSHGPPAEAGDADAEQTESADGIPEPADEPLSAGGGVKSSGDDRVLAGGEAESSAEAPTTGESFDAPGDDAGATSNAELEEPAASEDEWLAALFEESGAPQEEALPAEDTDADAWSPAAADAIPADASLVGSAQVSPESAAEEVPADSGPAEEDRAAPSEAPQPLPPTRRSFGRWVAATLIAVAAVAGGFAVLVDSGPRVADSPPPGNGPPFGGEGGPPPAGGTRLAIAIIEGLPPDGTLFVDGRQVRDRRVEFDPAAPPQLVLVAAGFIPDTIQPTAAPGDTVVVAFRGRPDEPVGPRLATVRVTGLPSNGVIIVDGRRIPGRSFEFQPGSPPRVMLQAEGYLSDTLDLRRIAAGATTNLEFRRRPRPVVPTATTARVQITQLPGGYRILRNGQPVTGTTIEFDTRNPPLIVVVAPGFLPDTVRLAGTAPGGTAVRPFTRRAEPATVVQTVQAARDDLESRLRSAIASADAAQLRRIYPRLVGSESWWATILQAGPIRSVILRRGTTIRETPDSAVYQIERAGVETSARSIPLDIRRIAIVRDATTGRWTISRIE